MIQDEAIGMLSSVYGNFEELVDFNPAGDGAYGQFFDQGIVYDYEIDGDVVQYQENRSDSEYIADYFIARLDAMGVRCDSDNPYEYWKGYTQTNLDAGGKPMCKNGTVPCGNRCLPRGQKCRLNSPGGRRGMSGLAKAAVGAAAIAGVAGAATLLSRKKGKAEVPKKAVSSGAAEALNKARKASRQAKEIDEQLNEAKRKFGNQSETTRQVANLSRDLDKLEEDLMSDKERKRRSKEKEDIAAMKKRFIS